jgi:alanine racemase
MGVIKANAYGHGLIECAKALESAGIDYLGVALLEEGVLLRKAGIKTPVHVFGGILGDQIEDFLVNQLDLTASSGSKLEMISKVASKHKLKAHVHLKIDTGMGRIGVRPETAASLIDLATSLPAIKVVGIFSHFASADEEDLGFTIEQTQRFTPVVSYAKEKLGIDVTAHIANSAGLLQYPPATFDMVRTGLGLFGVSPAKHLEKKLSLKPVMAVKSKVVFFKVVKAGESVSYGRTWTAKEDTRVVTVPIGYGDGYPRALSNKAQVLIRGKRYPIVGKICMDQLMVAIGKDEVFNGDEVTLVGRDQNEEISVTELADLSDSVAHEVLSGLNLRLPRKYQH